MYTFYLSNGGRLALSRDERLTPKEVWDWGKENSRIHAVVMVTEAVAATSPVAEPPPVYYGLGERPPGAFVAMSVVMVGEVVWAEKVPIKPGVDGNPGGRGWYVRVEGSVCSVSENWAVDDDEVDWLVAACVRLGHNEYLVLS